MIMTPASAEWTKTEHDLQEALVEKAVVQAKLEMAADILHDIGNAIVGFGTHLTRIRYSLDENKTENLLNLADFFAARQADIGAAIGDAKAGAVVNMLQNMADVQQAGRKEVQRSIEDQLHIIAHIQEILNIHRQYTAGRDTGEKKAVNLRGIISDCLSMLFASIDKRNIVVTVNITAEAPVLQGDRTRLMQVFMNLLKNSIEALDRTAVDKSISIRLYTEGDFLALEIKDSGSGFDKATAGLLFGRGFTTKSSGTGLGLHNCRTILEGHAGSLLLTSEGPGKGALATIKFKI
jgi:signal transduction histidine kinase